MAEMRMRDAAAFLLLLLTLLPLSSTTAQEDPLPGASEALSYADPTGFLSLRLPEHWERWSPETTQRILANLAPWPQTTSIFSLARSPDSFTCPCVWVARLESGTEKKYLDAVEHGAYPEAAFERIGGSDRVVPFTPKDERYFHDAGRGVLWGWQDHASPSGRSNRVAIVYVPTQTATAVLMFQATPELFDASIAEFVQIVDSLEVQPRVRPGRILPTPPPPLAEQASAPASALQPIPLVPPLVRPMGAVLLLLLLFAGVYGACENGARYAIKCMVLVVITGSVFLGNLVVDVRGPLGAGLPDQPGVPTAIGQGLAAALAIPIAFAVIAKWRSGKKRTQLANAWLLGSIVAAAGSLFVLFRG
jgi:hypothetical protein